MPPGISADPAALGVGDVFASEVHILGTSNKFEVQTAYAKTKSGK